MRKVLYVRETLPWSNNNRLIKAFFPFKKKLIKKNKCLCILSYIIIDIFMHTIQNMVKLEFRFFKYDNSYTRPIV